MARRYDITPVAESLLSDTRRRERDDDSSDKLLKAFLLKVGLGFADKAFQSKSENFMNNESIMAARAKYTAANKSAEQLKALEAEIATSGQSVTEFFAQRNRPLVTQRLSESQTEELKNTDAYNSWITEKSREAAIQQAEAYNAALSAANRIGSTEDFDAFIQLKNNRPKTTVDWAASKLMNIFSGRSQEEIDREALQSITDSKYIENAEQLALVQEAFNTTKDLPASYAYAKAVIPDDPNETSEAVSQIGFNKGQVTVVRYDKVTDGKGNVTQTEPTIITLGTAAEFVNDPQKQLDSLKSGFNFMSDARQFLDPEMFATFQSRLRDAKIIPTAIKTLDEYTTASKIFLDFMQSEEFIRDSKLEDKDIAMAASFAQNLNALPLKLAGIASIKDPEEQQKALQKILAAYNESSRGIRTLRRPEGAVPPSTVRPGSLLFPE